MKRIVRVGLPAFVAAIAVAAFMCASARAEQPSFSAMINVVFDNNTVMFYKGTGAGLSKGQVYTLVQDGRPVASVEIEKTDISYSIARIVSLERPVREGENYTFQPFVPEAVPSAGETEKRGRASKPAEESAAEEKPAEKQETIEVKESAKTSKRRETRTASEEAAPAPAPAPAAEEKPAADRKRGKSEPEKAEEKPKKEKTAKTADEKAIKTGASTTGTFGVGFTGLHIIPTAQVVPEHQARISYMHNKLNGSTDTVLQALGIEAEDTNMNSYHFGYGLSANAEIIASGAEENVNALYDTKLSSIAAKYRIPMTSMKKDKSDEETDLYLAIMGSQGKVRTGFVSSYKFSVYGAALDYHVSEQTSVHGFYGRAKLSGSGASAKEKLTGLGISHAYSEQAFLFAEHMRLEDGERMNSLGVRYLYSDEIALDAAYQMCTENYSYDMGGTIYSGRFKYKGYQLGANMMF